MSATVNLMVTVSAETAIAAGAVMVEKFASFVIADSLLALLTNQSDTLNIYDYGPNGEEKKLTIPRSSILNAYEEII